MTVYRHFTARFMYLVGIMMASILLINLYEDPGGQFRASKLTEQKYADIMLKKNNFAIASGSNERLMQKLVLTQLKERPDILVLGSSRSMAINHSLFPQHSFYNASVSGATLEDDIAFFYLYHQRGWTVPKVLILGLDPWVLNKNNQQQLWKSVATDYCHGAELISSAANCQQTATHNNWLINKYLQLISWDYLTASLRRVIYSFSGKSQTAINKEGDYNIRLFDGALVRSKSMEFATPANADLAGIHYADQIPVYSLGHYTALDSEHVTLLQNFIDYLLKQHVQIIFYLPPYEPKSYAGIEKHQEYKMVDASEQYFRVFAAKNHIKVVGSYNPDKAKVQASDFFDGMHMKVVGVNKIFGVKNSSFYNTIHIDYWV